MRSAPPRRESPAGPSHSRSFWLVVGIVCAILGAIAYKAGGYWGSQRLFGDVKTEAVQAKLPGAEQTPTQTLGAPKTPAPAKAKVTMEEREVTEADRQDVALKEAERRAAAGEPQDGAQLNEQGTGTDVGGASATPDEAVQGSGKYAVVAGSFLQRANADKLVRTLTSAGYRPTIIPYTKNGIRYQRVTVETFGDRAAADELVRRLAQQGVSAHVVTG